MSLRFIRGAAGGWLASGCGWRLARSGMQAAGPVQDTADPETTKPAENEAGKGRCQAGIYPKNTK